MHYNNRLTTPGQLKDEASQEPGAAGNIGKGRSAVFRMSLRCLTGAICLAAISACSSNYMIKATDGTVYQTQGAPSLQGGAYKFTDAQGNAQEVYLSKVAKVQKI
jgi:hypothetical protein